MNAKELRAAAERLRDNYSNWKYVEAGSLYGQDVIATCDHILATVHADDDKPVTREWLEEIGAYELDPDGFYIGWSDDAGWRLSWGGGNYGGWAIYGNDIADEITHSQLRHLLAGLGMGGGE